jgi:hypothetical protein
VYAYTTSTAVGSVTVTNGSYSTIVYIKGTAGAASNVAVAVPSATAVGTIPTITVSATDVFGNVIATGETITATVIGSTFADGSITKTLVTTTTAEGAADTTLVVGSKTASLATAVAGTVQVVVTGASSAATVTGLAAPIKAATSSFVVSDLNGTIAKLTADLAAEKAGRALDAQAAANAKAAATVTAAAELAAAKAEAAKAVADAATAKIAADAAADLAKAAYVAEYNALAKKWNAKNPKAKVVLKK